MVKFTAKFVMFFLILGVLMRLNSNQLDFIVLILKLMVLTIVLIWVFWLFVFLIKSLYSIFIKKPILCLMIIFLSLYLNLPQKSYDLFMYKIIPTVNTVRYNWENREHKINMSHINPNNKHEYERRAILGIKD